MEHMQAGLKRLDEMLPMIKSGEGKDGDYWSDLDRVKGLDYQTGYRSVFDAFYGDDAIRVTFDKSNYDIVNGQHRIWLAKQMGIDSLPIRLVKRI